MSAPGGASAAEPAAGEAGAGEEKGVDITKMSIEDLQKNLTVLNEEMRSLNINQQNLGDAMKVLADSRASVEAVKPTDEGKEILVPLTSAMYVPGRLASTKEVLVDVGTGYFVGKSLTEASAVLRRRQEMIQGSMDAVHKGLTTREQAARAMQQMLMIRAQEAQRAQEAARRAGGAEGGAATGGGSA